MLYRDGRGPEVKLEQFYSRDMKSQLYLRAEQNLKKIMVSKVLNFSKEEEKIIFFKL